jgi:hypothetical protein
MNRFIAGDRTPGGPKGPEMLARLGPAFDGPVILFQNIIEVLHRSMSAVLLQSVLGFEPHDGWWITSILVGVDDPNSYDYRTHLPFDYIVATTTVKTQVWIAVCVLSTGGDLEEGTSTIRPPQSLRSNLQVLSVSVFEKVPINPLI